jgi:hypothetical protein
MPHDRFVLHPSLLNIKEDEVVSLISEYKLHVEETEICGKGDQALSC